MGMKRLAGRFFQAVGLLTVAGLVLGAIFMTVAGRWLIAGDEPAPADYIVMLSGSSQRLLYAAELYDEGLAPTILSSRPASTATADPRMAEIKRKMGYPDYDTETYRTRFLEIMGVPPEDVAFYGDGVLSTVEEAEALRGFLGGRTATLLVVTSPYHVRRAGIILRDVLPDCEIRMLANPHEYWNERWWADQYAGQQVVLESAKLVHYLLGGAFRSGDPARSAP